MKPLSENDAEREMQKLSRRSFVWGGVAVAAGFAGWRWLVRKSEDADLPPVLRGVLGFNERLALAYFRPSRLAPTFLAKAAQEPRANGDDGLAEDFDPEAWRLHVEGLPGHAKPLALTLAEIRALPKVEMVTELKCIEGWSTVVHWGGVRLADFVNHYAPNASLPEYVAMETPDKGYYVGLDRESALHPQTLLCYEMNGAPLADDHGAPLRLAIPVKYGIKSIKRIGTIRFTADRPKDFWAERGYDWYAGH